MTRNLEDINEIIDKREKRVLSYIKIIKEIYEKKRKIIETNVLMIESGSWSFRLKFFFRVCENIDITYCIKQSRPSSTPVASR